jgi:hypothetical protein
MARQVLGVGAVKEVLAPKPAAEATPA